MVATMAIWVSLGSALEMGSEALEVGRHQKNVQTLLTSPMYRDISSGYMAGFFDLAEAFKRASDRKGNLNRLIGSDSRYGMDLQLDKSHLWSPYVTLVRKSHISKEFYQGLLQIYSRFYQKKHIIALSKAAKEEREFETEKAEDDLLKSLAANPTFKELPAILQFIYSGHLRGTISATTAPFVEAYLNDALVREISDRLPIDSLSSTRVHELVALANFRKELPAEVGRVRALYDQGMISEKEFEILNQKVLSQFSANSFDEFQKAKEELRAEIIKGMSLPKSTTQFLGKSFWPNQVIDGQVNYILDHNGSKKVFKNWDQLLAFSSGRFELQEVMPMLFRQNTAAIGRQILLQRIEDWNAFFVLFPEKLATPTQKELLSAVIDNNLFTDLVSERNSAESRSFLAQRALLNLLYQKVPYSEAANWTSDYLKKRQVLEIIIRRSYKEMKDKSDN